MGVISWWETPARSARWKQPLQWHTQDWRSSRKRPRLPLQMMGTCTSPLAVVCAAAAAAACAIGGLIGLFTALAAPAMSPGSLKQKSAPPQCFFSENSVLCDSSR